MFFCPLSSPPHGCALGLTVLTKEKVCRSHLLLLPPAKEKMEGLGWQHPAKMLIISLSPTGENGDDEGAEEGKRSEV